MAARVFFSLQTYVVVRRRNADKIYYARRPRGMAIKYFFHFTFRLYPTCMKITLKK